MNNSWPEKLKKARKTIGWSQDALASFLGVHRDTVYHWERGNKRPRDPFAAFMQLRKIYLLIGEQIETKSNSYLPTDQYFQPGCRSNDDKLVSGH